jgi:hypothetical protein
MVLLGWRADLLKVGLVAAAAAAALVLCTSATHRAAELLPSGRAHSPNNLAYIDASHVESYSEESLRNDGLMGLTYTLMRNGYLTLLLPETAPERLNQAGLFISVAPTRAFSAAERQAVRDFVENGGIFISTVGYEEREASQELLADFGFSIGGSPPGVSRAEPKPMGHFKAPYLNVKAPHLQAGHYMPHVRFHAAWPVQCTDPQAQVVAYGPENLPVILMRRIGRGKVVVIGDTGFAMNKNLEHEGGEPFEGLRENADFWRWFLAYLTDQPSWIPPPPPGAAPATTQPATRPATQGEVSP